MSENAPPSTAIGTDDDPTRGMPYHDKVTQDLKAMLQKKRQLERSVMQHDEAIYKKETDYLEETPYGNILTGFDNYIKGSSSSAPGGRRKAGITDQDRVFSRSSLRYNDTTVTCHIMSSAMCKSTLIDVLGFTWAFLVPYNPISCSYPDQYHSQRSHLEQRHTNFCNIR